MSRASNKESLLRKILSGDRVASGLAACALSLVAGFIALPIVSLIVWTVNENAWRAMASPVARDALLLSMKTTSISMLIIISVGTPAAYVLARAEFPGKRLVDSLIDIPAVLPPSAAGIALLLTFGRFGLVGQYLNVFGITLSFTTAAVVIAEVFVAAHFYVRQATVGFSQVRREVEEAAMVDGAGRFSTFLRVTVPLAFPALVAGAVMSWARALGEFGGTVIFAGSFRGITQTVPLAIFAEFQSNIDAAVALSVMVLGFAFTVIVVARYLLGKAAEFERQVAPGIRRIAQDAPKATKPEVRRSPVAGGLFVGVVSAAALKFVLGVILVVSVVRIFHR